MCVNSQSFTYTYWKGNLYTYSVSHALRLTAPCVHKVALTYYRPVFLIVASPSMTSAHTRTGLLIFSMCKHASLAGLCFIGIARRQFTSRWKSIFQSPFRSVPFRCAGRMGGSRGPLAPTTSCPHPPVKSKSIDRAPKSAQDFLCKSWPPLQRKTFASVEEDWDEDFGLFDGLKKQSTQMYVRLAQQSD